MRRPHPLVIVVILAAALGLYFAGVSTSDFAKHQDRQVHNVHCSFVPGADDTEAVSDCKVTMMSRYSSVFRTSTWGGIPISLPAMSVFVFLLFFAGELTISRREAHRRATGFLALAAVLPFVTSIAMAVIAFTTLGAACKLCIGIYVSSAICFAAAIALWLRARRLSSSESNTEESASQPVDENDPAWVSGVEPPPPLTKTVVPPTARTDWGYLITAFAFGVALVLIPVALYASSAPDHSKFVGSCGALAEPEDPYGVMVPLDSNASGASAIEVLDPLCPACNAFEHHLEASGLAGKLNRKALLFPLDNSCNWMVSQAMHPGACSISEAVLCAGDKASAVVEWAFANQQDIIEATTADATAAAKMQIPVGTPQLYVEGVKLCAEDFDLGLEYALTRLIDGELGTTPIAPTLEAEIERRPPRQRPAQAEPKGASSPATPTDDKTDKAESPAVAPTDGPKAEGSAPKVPEPAKPEPAKTEPAKTEPAKTEPAKTEPAKTESPGASAPKTNEPAPSQEKQQ
jgi:uncharacterized membrane protein